MLLGFVVGEYINRILSGLDSYIRKREDSCGPRESFVYVGEIPSIPGGLLEIEEVNERSVPHIEGITARFEYLEGTPQEDLKQVRQAITSQGLEPF